MNAAEKLRETLARYHARKARAFLEEQRGVEEEDRVAIPWPVGARFEDLFESARDALPEQERNAIAAHFARATMDHALRGYEAALIGDRETPCRDGSMTFSTQALMASALSVRGVEVPLPIRLRLIEARASGALPRLREARERARRVAGETFVRLGAKPHADAGPAAALRVEQAERFLDGTDDLWRELSTRLPRHGDSWLHVLDALRGQEDDARYPARDRFRRVAADISSLGFDSALRGRVRVEPPHLGRTPRHRIVIMRPHDDVRIVPHAFEQGERSEGAALEAVGRALGLALLSPALPEAFSRPVVATCSRALGVLLRTLLGEPRIHDARGALKKEIGRAVLRTRAAIVLETRVDAAMVVATAARSGQRSAELLSRAMMAEVPLPVAAYAVSSTSAAGARFRARSAALGWRHALRERFDEDFYRNPRTGPMLRALVSRGGSVSVEEVSAELGVGLEDAVSHALEWG